MVVYVSDTVACEVIIHEVDEERIKGLAPKTALMVIDALLAEGMDFPNVIGEPEEFRITTDNWTMFGDPGRGHYYGLTIGPDGERIAKELLTELISGEVST